MSCLSVNGVFRFPTGQEYEGLWLYGKDMGPACFVIMIHDLYAPVCTSMPVFLVSFMVFPSRSPRFGSGTDLDLPSL